MVKVAPRVLTTDGFTAKITGTGTISIEPTEINSFVETDSDKGIDCIVEKTGVEHINDTSLTKVASEA